MIITETEEIDTAESRMGESAGLAVGRSVKASGWAGVVGETVEEDPGAAVVGETMEDLDGTSEESGNERVVPPEKGFGRISRGFAGAVRHNNSGYMLSKKFHFQQEAVQTQRFHLKRMFEWLLPYLIAVVVVIGVGTVVLLVSSLRTQHLYDMLQEQYGEYIADE